MTPSKQRMSSKEIDPLIPCCANCQYSQELTEIDLYNLDPFLQGDLDWYLSKGLKEEDLIFCRYFRAIHPKNGTCRYFVHKIPLRRNRDDC